MRLGGGERRVRQLLPAHLAGKYAEIVTKLITDRSETRRTRRRALDHLHSLPAIPDNISDDQNQPTIQVIFGKTNTV